MLSTEQLFKVAEQMRRFADVLKRARNNIINLNNEKTLNDLEQYQIGENRAFIIKRKLREAFKEVFMFLSDNGQEQNLYLTTFLSLCCYNLDWDHVFDVVGEDLNKNFCLTDEKGNNKNISDYYDVKSWGTIRQQFDINFLRFIRNGLAHGKFDCNFEDKKIIIKMRNGTFVVEMPMSFMFFQPYDLYRLYEQSQSPDIKHVVTILGETKPPYKKAFLVTLKNDDSKYNEIILYDSKTTKSLKRFLIEIKKEMDEFEQREGGHKLSPKEKIDSIGLIFSEELDASGEAFLSKFKLLANYLGMSVENCKIVDYDKDIYQNNKFIKYTIENGGTLGKISESLISSKMSDEARSFYAYFYLLGIISSADNGSEAKFINKIKEGMIFATMDEICEFADRAYVNFVCNYLEGKFKISDSWKNVPATEYFLANSFTSGNSIYDIFQASQNKAYIRNCLVHPGYFHFNGVNYKFTDYDKTGVLVFDAEITRENLIKFTTDLFNHFKAEHITVADMSL